MSADHNYLSLNCNCVLLAWRIHRKFGLLLQVFWGVYSRTNSVIPEKDFAEEFYSFLLLLYYFFFVRRNYRKIGLLSIFYLISTLHLLKTVLMINGSNCPISVTVHIHLSKISKEVHLHRQRRTSIQKPLIITLKHL